MLVPTIVILNNHIVVSTVFTITYHRKCKHRQPRRYDVIVVVRPNIHSYIGRDLCMKSNMSSPLPRRILAAQQADDMNKKRLLCLKLFLYTNNPSRRSCTFFSTKKS
mmetsp:Transcript_10953/g.16738  ORF Transcript_10953/g.16738 Transcript_10953/m.16738 type:complete len:107 (+) Transcript_10953:231-551(+)